MLSSRHCLALEETEAEAMEVALPETCKHSSVPLIIVLGVDVPVGMSVAASKEKSLEKWTGKILPLHLI